MREDKRFFFKQEKKEKGEERKETLLSILQSLMMFQKQMKTEKK